MEKITHLTVETVPRLWSCRVDIFRNSQVDLAGVEDIDSAGIAFLIKWSKSLPDGKLKLLHVPEDIMSLLETYHIKELFEI